MKHAVRSLSWIALAALSVAGQEPSSRPNVVFILIDDMGWNDCGFMGNRFHETPRIDALAKEGMVFTQAYANGPNCAPSRACLMSGQYGPRHGIYTVGSSARGRAEHRRLVPIPNKRILDDGVVTLPEVLRDAGYVTAHMGKWHLGPDPRTQGFQVNVAGNQAGHPRSYFAPYKNKDLPDGPKGEYLTDRLTDEAIGFLEKHREKPFFLYLSHFAVHTPVQAKKGLRTHFQKKDPSRPQRQATYAAMIKSLDDGIGRVLDALTRLQLHERTIVFFFSDNGGHLRFTSMKPLRGGKGMLYEGGIREPLIVRWPGRIPAGKRSPAPVIGTDFFPTILSLADVPTPKEKVLDGVDLAPVLLGRGDLPPRDLHWHFPAYLQANAKQGTWRTTPAAAIRRDNWKLIEFFEDGRTELYDLAADAGEANDLAGQQPARVKELHEAMLAWRKSVKAPVPTERNPAWRGK